MSDDSDQPFVEHGYLEGQLLIATPLISGSAFSKSVVFIAAHSSEGAMGLIVNHILDNISYSELFDQLDLPADAIATELPVHFGGPVEINRGFVIYQEEEGVERPETILTVGDISISASINILREIAEGKGPKNRMLLLGYAGWSAGQLEDEVESSSWISAPAKADLIFQTDNEQKWESAAQTAGVDMRKLSLLTGHG